MQKTYTVTRRAWIAGRLRQEGEVVELTPKAAKYHLAAGAIVEGAPASKGKKK